MPVNQIPEQTRREIFIALVEAEDRGEAPQSARRLVAEQFGITPGQVKEVEEEGLDKTWPPLEECDE